MNDAPVASARTSKRRWRYSLKSVFWALSVLCITIGLRSAQVAEHRNLMESLRQNGCHMSDTRFDPIGPNWIWVSPTTVGLPTNGTLPRYVENSWLAIETASTVVADVDTWTDDDFEKLSRLKGLEYLWLRGVTPSKHGLSWVSYFRDVSHVNITCNDYHDDFSRLVGGLDSQSRLRIVLPSAHIKELFKAAVESSNSKATIELTLDSR